MNRSDVYQIQKRTYSSTATFLKGSDMPVISQQTPLKSRRLIGVI